MGFFVGIDGGGFKTAAALCDEQGRLLAQAKTGRLVVGPKTPGKEEEEILSGLLSTLYSLAGVKREKITMCVAGVNGVDYADEHADQLRFVAQSLSQPSNAVRLVNDSIIAMWGAANQEALVAIQHGTGFTAAFRDTYDHARTFDILGNGLTFDLRRELMKSMVRMIDGRLPETGLKSRVLSFLEVSDPERFAELLCRGGIDSRKILETPPLIFAAWQENDAGARRLVEAAAQDYACAFGAMFRKINSGQAAGRLGGGLVRFAPPQFYELVHTFLLAEGFDIGITPPEMPPELGALVMAAYCAGQSPRPFFEEVRRQHASQGQRKTETTKGEK